jgi:hypothetical protein
MTQNSDQGEDIMLPPPHNPWIPIESISRLGGVYWMDVLAKSWDVDTNSFIFRRFCDCMGT